MGSYDFPKDDPRSAANGAQPDAITKMSRLFQVKYGMPETDAKRQAEYYLNNPGTMSATFLKEAQAIAPTIDAADAKLATYPEQERNLKLLNNLASYQAERGGASGVEDLRPLKLLDNAASYRAAKGATAGVGLPPLGPHFALVADDGGHGTPASVSQVATSADDQTAGLKPLPAADALGHVRYPPAPLTSGTVAIPAAPTPAHDEDADLSTWQRYALLYGR